MISKLRGLSPFLMLAKAPVIPASSTVNPPMAAMTPRRKIIREGLPVFFIRYVIPVMPAIEQANVILDRKTIQKGTIPPMR